MTVLDSLKAYKAQFAVTLLLFGGLYYSIIPPMVMQWYDDPDSSHGFLVPLIAGYFIYQRRDDLRKVAAAPNSMGFPVLIAGLLALTLGYLGTELFTMRASLIIILAGLVICFFGREAFRILLLPLCFLIFMVPVPKIVYNLAAFPLKLFVAKYSVLFLDTIGIIVLREGNIIMFPDVTLEVADACSGLRSLMSLLTVGVAFAFIVKTSGVKRAIIIISAVPIAVFTNAVRVIVTGILAQYRGAEAAEGFFHEFAGLLVFGLALIILFITGVTLKGKNK